jgi:hypothetical protein
MKFDLAESTQLAIRQTMEYWQIQGFMPEQVESIVKAMHLILTLTEKYAVLVMNPPYMGSGNMNEVLTNYVKRNYEKGKADLCTVFMLMQANRTTEGGYYANIIPPSWMFLSGFEDLRRNIIENQTIQSLLHLSRGVFGADFGSVTTVIQNSKLEDSRGTYFRLIERTFQEFDQKHLMQLFEKTLSNHDFRYFFADYSKDVDDIVYSEKGAKIYYPNVEQANFKKIPGCPIGYWLSENWPKLFDNNDYLETSFEFKKGMSTGDNTRFIKDWYEVSLKNIYFNCTSEQESLNDNRKWYPINCGGTFRKWYGNQDSVVNWYHNGEEMKSNAVVLNHGGHWSRYITSVDKFFREGLSWNAISSGDICVRHFGKGFIFCSASMCGYGDDVEPVIGLLNSKVGMDILKVLAPTMNYGPLQVKKIPFLEQSKDCKNLVEQNILLSKLDWDSHETSWDFEANPFVALRNETVTSGNLESSFKLSSFVEQFEDVWEERFNQLHQNEEELNRQFIEIYGLQDELSPEVPKNEITILQQGEINLIQAPGSDYDYTIQWNEDVLMKQLISYAVGVWMGRYKLGTKGLHIAHPNPTDKELQEYWYGGVQVYIDDDGLIPVLPQNSPFDDNLSSRISDFVRITFGEEKLTENLNYIEQKLGTSIDQYVQKDFWKDHKKMYQNRPIYWLFSSSKGAFKCLAYMHRMNAYTAERVRSNYLLPYIEFLQNQIGELENRAAVLSTTENRKLLNFQKALEECREYHERLQVVAEQAIAFDLDDGVIVNYAKFGDVLAKIK